MRCNEPATKRPVETCAPWSSPHFSVGNSNLIGILKVGDSLCREKTNLLKDSHASAA
jgi:hypothetical protein